MKTTSFKKLTAMLLAIMLVFSMCITGVSVSAAEGTKTIYFEVSDNWKQDGARFAVYAWAGTTEGKFTSMTNVDGNIYTAEIADSNTQVIFIRMNPELADNNWNNSWNQTVDLTVPTDGKNCFKINAGEWNNANGTWVEYKPEPTITSPVDTTAPVTTAPVTGPTTDNTIFFVASDNWKQDDARFAMYAWTGNNEGTFTSMTANAEGMYTAELPDGCDKVIFVRMNPASADNNWNNSWNQTTDLAVPAGKNCFTINAGEWDNANGTWSYYGPTTPVTTAPVTTAPVTTAPVTTVPVTTVPVTTVPVTTAPVTTAPVTTAPVTTVPVTTAPVTTVPETTIPVTTVPPMPDDTIYFVASDNWKQDGARFAMYAWTGDNEGTFTSMTEVEAGVYAAKLADSCDKVIFVRMNPASAENNWTNKWNQTTDLTVPTDGKNCFTVNAGEWEGANGTWTFYGPDPTVPDTTAPVTTEPVTTEPVTTEPVTTEPVTTEPVTTEPVTTVPPMPDDTIYFVASDNWKQDGARFAMYAWTGDNEGTFTSMTEVEAGVYAAKLADGCDKVLFVRMNPASADNNWTNKWNQTTDLTVPTDGKNCFTVNAGEWEGANGTWTFYGPDPTVPDTTAPVTTEPVTTAPVTTEPVTTEPVTTEPVTTEPVTTEPVTTVPPMPDDTIYFVASDNWKQDGARFAMYAWTGDNEGTFTSMTEVATGVYAAKLADGCDKVLFVRMNPASADNNWTNKWNQTTDLTVPADKNCFTVNAGEWEGANGTWSVYNPPVPTTAPVTTAPVTTVPVTTVPVTTAPVTTAPVTTVPVTTVPVTTAPVTTVPVTTAPPTTVPTNPDDNVVAIFGDINLELAETEEADIYTGVTELQAGTYKFNVNNKGTTHGMNYTYTDTAVIDYSNGYKAQSVLKVSGGRYTFTFNAATKKLTIKFKSFDDIVELVGDINAELVRPKKTSTVFTGSIRLDAGTYKFNVNEHGTLFGLNYEFTDVIYDKEFIWTAASTFIATGGIYSVRYDTSNNQLKIMHAPAGLGDVTIFGDISLPLAEQGNGVYSAQTVLDAGSYDIRVDSFGTIYGCGSPFTNTINTEFKTEWKASATFTVTEKMKFTFTFDTKTNKVKVFNEVIDTTKVKLSFDDLGAFEFVRFGPPANYVATIDLPAGVYTFRIDEFGVPMGGKHVFTDNHSNLKYDATFASATTMTATGGTYTFAYNSNTNILSVTKES